MWDDAVCASPSPLLAPAPGRARERTSPQPGPRRRAFRPADAPRREPALRRRYRAELWRERAAATRALFGYMIRCAMHYHHLTLAGDMAGAGRRRELVLSPEKDR